MLEVDSKFFVNEFNRSLVLGRSAGYRQGINFRVRNHSEYTLTPLIGLGVTFLDADSYLTGTAIVPLAYCDMQLPAIDTNDNLFDETYLFLDYVDIDDEVLGVGLEFDLMQDTEFRILYFVDEGIQGAFSS